MESENSASTTLKRSTSAVSNSFNSSGVVILDQSGDRLVVQHVKQRLVASAVLFFDMQIQLKSYPFTACDF